MKIAIIGAGAAGCFCAIELKRQMPSAEVHLLESKSKPLAKVAITGGGRCNLTNTFAQVAQLKDVYPRGDKLMRRALSIFSHKDTCRWFEREGVRLTTQPDQCIFPQSQDAMQIVHTLTHLMGRLGVHLHLSCKVKAIEHLSNAYRISAASSQGLPDLFDRVVVTTGGHPTPQGFEMLEPLQLQIEPPVPSLFTFNIAGDWHQALMGTVVDKATATIAGTKFKSQGPLLLTHWGMSGPAILKLSSHAARHLAEAHYRCTLIVNWMEGRKEDEVRADIEQLMHTNAQKLVGSAYPTCLTARHWAVLLQRATVPDTQRWGALNAKHINRLVNTLSADAYEVTGRCAFKEEFVTCGGVSLHEINPNTLEAKNHPGLYLAGEVLDVDAVTGGYNLQAAWSMGYVVAHSLTSNP